MNQNYIEKFYPNGKLYFRIYRNAAGKYHRDPAEGPAIEAWDVNGKQGHKNCFVDGKYHRDPGQGPAYEAWDVNGNKYAEEYYMNGKAVLKPEARVDINMEVKPNIEPDNSTAIIATSLILAAICGALKQKNSTKKYSKFLDTNEKFANVEITTKQCAR